jgi:HEAT repeat protein
VKISGNSHDGLPIMLEALQSVDEPTRLSVLESLGEAGASAKDAATAIIRCVVDKSLKFRASAALALGRIGERSPEVFSALIPLLADSEPEVRLNTVIALSALSGEGSPAFAALQQAQQDQDPRVAAAAKAATQRIHSQPSQQS